MNDILFGNTNRPVIKKLAGRYFKSSKSRNVIAVIAIILTSILFTTIFHSGFWFAGHHSRSKYPQGGR